MKNLLQQEAVSDSWNHRKTVVQRTSHSQKDLAPLNWQWGERTVQNSDEGYEQGMLRFFGEVRTHLAVTEGDYVESTAVSEANYSDDWDQWQRSRKDEVKAL